MQKIPKGVNFGSNLFWIKPFCITIPFSYCIVEATLDRATSPHDDNDASDREKQPPPESVNGPGETTSEDVGESTGETWYSD